jgi:L-lactate dehydrogenase (cytochrome)
MPTPKNVERQFPRLKEFAPLLKFKAPRFDRKRARLEAALTIWDLRDIAKRRTPKGPFDYTDGSAETESSLERARQAYRDIEFVPNILRDVSAVDITRSVLGETFAMPMGIAPTGFARMMQTEGEIAGARAAQKYGIPFSLSTLGTTSIEDVVAAAPDGVNWFQLYMWKDREGSMALVERAQKAGVKNLLLTVDVPASGQRLRDYRNGLTVPPQLTARTLINALPRPAWWINFLTTPAISFVSLSNWPGTVGELLDYMFDPTMTFADLNGFANSGTEPSPSREFKILKMRKSRRTLGQMQSSSPIMAVDRSIARPHLSISSRISRKNSRKSMKFISTPGSCMALTFSPRSRWVPDLPMWDGHICMA